jgi:hypothetical protein
VDKGVGLDVQVEMEVLDDKVDKGVGLDVQVQVDMVAMVMVQ